MGQGTTITKRLGHEKSVSQNLKLWKACEKPNPARNKSRKDIEGAVTAEGKVVVTQSRPQV